MDAVRGLMGEIVAPPVLRLNHGWKQTGGEVRPRGRIQFLRAYVAMFGGRVGDQSLNSVLISPPPLGAFPPGGALLLGTPLDFLNPGVPNIPRTSGCPPGVPAQLLSSRGFPGLRVCCFSRHGGLSPPAFWVCRTAVAMAPLPPILP